MFWSTYWTSIVLGFILISGKLSNGHTMKLRVVSYNVLSSSLSSPSHYSTLNPEHLDPTNRLPVVLGKLEKQLAEGENTVFCLQEVSTKWAGEFHTFFAKRGYHMVSGLYGRKFNGYMGVSIAWPTESFEPISVDISRLSDTREWPPPEEKPLWSKIWQSTVNPLRLLGLKGKEERDPWDYSEYRFNVLATAALRHRSSDIKFCLGTYHMPCAFFAPQVMTIHSDMALAHVQSVAMKYDGIPCILAGDFNIKPTDSMYHYITTGELERDDPCYPIDKSGVQWTPSCFPMRSAYASCNDGNEPDFTNFARVKEDEPFIDTLDYIFISKEWTAVSTLPLPNRDTAGGPFPNLESGEPSDHILIAADLSL